MAKNNKLVCDQTNPKFNDLLSNLLSLSENNGRQQFSYNFNHLIVKYDLNQKRWQNNVKGKYSPQVTNILNQLLSLWQQIQEDDLPFSYVKPQLDQKTFEEKLSTVQSKIRAIKKH